MIIFLLDYKVIKFLRIFLSHHMITFFCFLTNEDNGTQIML